MELKQIYNLDLNFSEFEGIKNEAGLKIERLKAYKIEELRDQTFNNEKRTAESIIMMA